MLKDDRTRAGWSVARTAYELGVSILHAYRELEAGERTPTFETWDRICKTFGWPQMFASAPGEGVHPRASVAVVDAGTSNQRVVAITAPKHIRARATVEQIAPAIAPKRVRSAIAPKRVRSAVAAERVGAGPTYQQIRTCGTFQHVATVEPQEPRRSRSHSSPAGPSITSSKLEPRTRSISNAISHCGDRTSACRT